MAIFLSLADTKYGQVYSIALEIVVSKRVKQNFSGGMANSLYFVRLKIILKTFHEVLFWKKNFQVSRIEEIELKKERWIQWKRRIRKIKECGLPKSRAAPRRIRRRGQGCGRRPPPRIPSASARWGGRRGLEVGTQSPARCKQKTVSEANLQNVRKFFREAADCLPSLYVSWITIQVSVALLFDLATFCVAAEHTHQTEWKSFTRSTGNTLIEFFSVRHPFDEITVCQCQSRAPERREIISFQSSTSLANLFCILLHYRNFVWCCKNVLDYQRLVYE